MIRNFERTKEKFILKNFNMKKLCIITYKYNNEWWIEKVVRNLINWLIDKYEIHIITSEIKDIQNDKIIFHKIKLFTNFWILRWIQFFFFSYFKFNKLNKIYNFDIIHKHATSLINSDFFTAHSVHKESLKSNLKQQNTIFKKIKYFIFSLYPIAIILEYINLKNTKKIIALSQWIKKELIKSYKIKNNKIIIIPNWINPKNCKYQEKNINNDLNLIFVGKDYIRKWLNIVIDSLNIIVNKKNIKNIKLFILWYDKVNFNYFKKKIKNLNLENNINLIWHTKNVYKYYKLSQIFVFPTYYEAFWLVILEASICWLAILTSKTHWPEDLIKNWYNWYLLKRNSEEYANKIIELYNNKKLLKMLGNNARKHVIENYSWDKIIKKHIKLYENIS